MFGKVSFTVQGEGMRKQQDWIKMSNIYNDPVHNLKISNWRRD